MKYLFKVSKKTISDFNKHVKVVPLYQYQPIISERAYVFPNSTIVGESVIAADSFIGSNSVIRGDMNRVFISENVYVNENCSLNTVHRILNSGEKADLKIEENVIIGPGCTLTSCTVKSNVQIGPNSVIGEGSIINKGAVIGPNSVVPPNRIIPEYEVWMGNPVRYVKKLSKEEKKALPYKIALKKRDMRKFFFEERGYSGVYLEIEKNLKKD
jgi:carbonic anhydrase/acetyltransferase-like protein (isoleucine patch superfamily)